MITDKGLHFPTKEEAAYPQLLCDRVAHVVKSLAMERGFKPAESLLEQSKQAALHRGLKPHCAAVLKGKRLLLFGEMLREISYPDAHLITRHL